MNTKRYTLEPYKGMKTRYRCPCCQQRDKTFSLYIDTVTGEHLHPNVGRCNRESKCGYHYTPKQYFKDNNISFDTPQLKAYKPPPIKPLHKPVSFIPVKVFKASLKGYESNHFVKFLINLFGVEITEQLVSRYFIATSKYWQGATVFWQIDTQGKVRTGKIMLYSPNTGKRIKMPYNHISWVHSALKQPEFELKQCLFGEHLLIDKSKPVAIVESEKTAIIASVYLPQFIWVAVGSLTNLNAERCSVLKGRNVILFPDLNGFDKWSSRAKALSNLARFAVSDLLERKATDAERKQGFDLADYLINFNHKDFAIPEAKAIEPPPAVQPLLEVKPILYPEKVKSEYWDKEISELENYFAGLTLPTQPQSLNKYSKINDCKKFIESHLARVKAYNGNQNFLPYLNRLFELKTIITP
ncbi:MAG: hypothetical protein JNJ58_12870 [Chitinophagaceae bacterium]|nr:hypothetical protein [Chitinophagaceae bacterium]